MRGIGLLILGIGLLCTMDAMAKLLMANGMPALQLLALRSVIIVPLIMLVFSLQGNLAALKPTRPILHMGRGIIGFVAPLSFFLGISLLPLTDAVTVSFSSIFMIALLSIIFFNLCVGVISLILLPWYWQPQTLDQYGMLAGLSLVAVTGHFLMTSAFSHSEASLLSATRKPRCLHRSNTPPYCGLCYSTC